MDITYQNLRNAIMEGQPAAGVTEALALVQSGKKPIELFSECIEPTLTTVGDQFSKLEIFLPELINAAETVKAIQAALEPYMGTNSASATAKGRVIIATVYGDMHDIGKNIVKSMLEVNGFITKDLGVDVSPQTILNSAKEFQADIIALSALMLTSLPYMKDVIDFISMNSEERKKYKIIVGGGSVSKEWANNAGADGYGENAIDAVQLVRQELCLD